MAIHYLAPIVIESMIVAALVATAIARVAVVFLKRFRRRRPVIRRRNVYERLDPINRPFYTDYLHERVQEEIQDPNSRLAKLFRRRFRVPYPLFQALLNMTIDLGFKDYGVDITGRSCVPLGSKLLGVLRVLGRSVCFDGIAELAGGS